MKNKLHDLNNHLFTQLEKLSDDSLTGEDLKMEINRANAIVGISSQIIGAAAVTVNAMKLVAGGNINREDIPLLLNSSDKSK